LLEWYLLYVCYCKNEEKLSKDSNKLLHIVDCLLNTHVTTFETLLHIATGT